MSRDTIAARVTQIRWEATDVLSFWLAPLEGSFPAVAAGAHLDVHLRPDLVRSYSLSNAPDDAGSYRITVGRLEAGRGGSRHLHDQVRVGQVLQLGIPRNNFALAAGAHESVLVAGGIGITPLFAMVHRLVTEGRPWQLHYAVRTRDRAAFLPELTRLAAKAGRGKVFTYFDGEPEGERMQIARMLADCPRTAHVYGCGPAPMLEEFVAQARARFPSQQVHVESFGALAPLAPEGGFVVELARSKRVLPVAKGQSILQVLLADGIDVPFSCEAGVCGSCEVRVLEGIPAHCDSVLSERERAEGRTMMICCSGAKSARLVLDL